MSGIERHYFEFDGFRVEVEDRRLIRNDSVVTLTPRAFDILLTLVQHAGQTVEKDDLMQAVWQDTFVEEGNLNRHVSTLRRILGDDPKEQRYIKTIPKRGYRFTAKITERIESSESIAIDSVSRTRLVIKEETIEKFWTTPRAIVACSMLIGAVLLGVWALWDRKADARTATSATSDAAYDRGRALWQTRRPDHLHEATLLLESVVSRQPGFALAHSALADAYAFDYGNWKKAEAEATRAIELDPSLGEPHASLGFVRMFWEWRLTDAEGEFKKAVELSPNYATGHQWFALNLAATGHVDAALAEIQKAVTLDPDSVAINTDYCQILYFAERFEDAASQCRKVIEIDPANVNAHELLYQIYMSAGSENEAVGKFVENLSISKNERLRVEAPRFREAHQRGGIGEFRKAQLDFYREIAISHHKLARVFAEMGEVEAAIAALEEAVEKKEFDTVFYAPDPAFQKIRTGPHRTSIAGLPLK